QNKLKIVKGMGKVLFCKAASSLVFLVPSLSSAQLRFNSVTTCSTTPSNPRVHRMATEASSSSSPATNGNAINHPSSSANDRAAPSSASSAIDFLSLCQRLKVSIFVPSISSQTEQKAPPPLCTIVGDITPSDGVSKEEKSRREQEALNYMCNILGGGPRAKEIAELWTEYENNSSPEAKIVKDFDKVEMILQAMEYENGKFQTELGKSWALEIASRRKQGQ
ncbi:uncharacterized protein LOC110812651, partial [Carica papaya]|uniref:uncharacterized protein LOC110812651 n=1 Tax=Carica papaya TaxID=3649 RepID=UPI000B8C9EE9